MAWGSSERGTNRGENNPDVTEGLDALFNPFKMTGRTLKGATESVFPIFRGLARAGGAVLSDISELALEPIGQMTDAMGYSRESRGLGPEGWWTDEQDGAFRPSTYRDVLQPIGASFANTVDTLGDLTMVANLSPGWEDGGVDRAKEHLGERLQQWNDDPFNFLLEHVGNAAIVGGLAAKPAQLGIASQRGAITGAQAAQGMRPLAGRGVRTTARQATREAATEAAAQGSRFSAPQVTRFADDVVGHPYRTAWNKARGSRAAQLIRDPGAFDPVTQARKTADNLGIENLEGENLVTPETTKLYRGMAEEFDPARVPEEGMRFTDDLDYALSNTNEGRHQYLYKVEVPASRVDIGTSEFAGIMGEGAGPRGARLGIDELERMGRVPQSPRLGLTLDELRAAEPEAALPPVPEGHVRLYRTQARGQGVPSGEGGRYIGFTSSLDDALGYYDRVDTAPEHLYVDVPAEQAARYQGNHAEFLEQGTGTSYAPEVEYFLPEEMAARATPSESLSLHQDILNDIRDLEAQRSAESAPPTSIDLPDQLARNKGGGTSTDPAHQLGLVESVAQGIGHTIDDIQKSKGYQSIFGEDAVLSRRVRDQFREGMLTGTGRIADAVREKFFDKDSPVGNVNVRRKWDPSRVERLLLRDLKNLGKREDAGNYARLIDNLEIDQISAREVPGRVKEVLSGDRPVGQTLDPEGLLTRIRMVMDEAKRQTGGADNLDQVLGEMLPGVDPMGLHLLALNALEKARGLPENSLTSALTDYVSMDRYADTNRRAQAALRGSEFDVPTSESARFRIPEEELGVDLNTLGPEGRQLFEDAAAQWRREQGNVREPMLVEEGLIPQGGTRIGLTSDQPTQFPTALDDLPLSKEWRRKIRAAEKNKDLQQRTVDEVAGRLEELAESGRALYKPRKSGEGGVYRTQTGEAMKRHTARLRREHKKLETATRKLDEVENAARVAVENAPVSARNLLVYGSRVAPEQAKALRAMADEGVGDPAAYRALADELDAVPKTIEDLNSADVYLTYLRDMKDKGLEPGELGPSVSSNKAIDTRQPAGTRRRGTDVDIDYSRDFRARAYWQDSEFQSWFLARQADEFVKSQGLAKTGKARLLETGDWTPEQIAELTPGQAQQALERLGLRVYQPDQLFGTGRKPTTGQSALEADWITPFAEQNLMGAVSQPGWIERVLAEGIIDPTTKTWKVAVLPLRVGWQVNNVAGNALLTTLVGQVSPFDYPSLMRASRKAVSDWNKGITNQVKVPLNDNYRAHLVAALQKADDSQRVVIQEMLDQDSIILKNEVLAEIASSGLVRGDFAFLNNSQFLRDIGANANQNILQQFGVNIPELPGEIGRRARNIRQTAREGVDYAYHVNEATDTMHRAAIYIDQIGKGVPHPQAMTQVLKALGDYNKMNGFERRVLKRVYPFYPWMRHISEVVVSSLKPDNITRSLIFTHMTNIFGEPNEWEELLPEWAGGHMYMGMNEHGKPKFLSTRGLNPFLDVFDPVAQPNMRGLLRPSNPGIQYAFEQMSGTSVLTGKPFSAPGQVFGSDEMPRPPTHEYLARNIPQLGTARDVYRDLMGQPLTRYGTGEAAFFEGAEEGRSSIQDITQLFGYNVKPLDVENMREQELVQDLRKAEAEANYREQMEEQEGRQARDLLNALPGLGG